VEEEPKVESIVEVKIEQPVVVEQRLEPVRRHNGLRPRNRYVENFAENEEITKLFKQKRGVSQW